MSKKKLDYLVVGAGLWGATFAREARLAGKTVLVVEKANNVAGHIYTQNIHGIDVHLYGAHIFHTSNERVWKYVTDLVPFNNFINSPVANYQGEIYNLPFNMNTFSKMWGIRTPEEAKAIIEAQRSEVQGAPKNLEEQAISLVGRDIYEKLIKGYTEKQWGRECKDLPAFLIRRLPVRFTYDNNYFDDKYQGIPENGYTDLVEKMLEGIEVRLNTDYLENREELDGLAETVIYTGQIDRYYDYVYGPLEYRSLHFDHRVLNTENFQGNAVFNYTSKEVEYTRVLEHKHFNPAKKNPDKTIISYEYPQEWTPEDEPYYPIIDDKNQALYKKYEELSKNEENVIFGGRLAKYTYNDMDDTIEAALAVADSLFS